MKKLLVILMAVMMVSSLAGKAMAAFEIGNVQLVAYGEPDNALPIEDPGKEVHHDLGPNSEAYADLSIGPIAGHDTGITLTDLGLAAWSDVYVGIFGGGWDASYNQVDGVFSTAAEPVTISAGSYSQYTSGIFNMSMSDPFQPTDANGNISYDKYGTYLNEMHVGGVGSYAGWVNAPGVFGAELQLADGCTTATMYAGNALGASKVGEWTLDTSGGSLVLGYTPVPVPAAVWLLGSGLIGLVGIGRKKRAS